MKNENFLQNEQMINEIISDGWNKNIKFQVIADMLNSKDFLTQRGDTWSKDNVSFYGRKKLNLEQKKNRISGYKKTSSSLPIIEIENIVPVQQNENSIAITIQEVAKEVNSFNNVFDSFDKYKQETIPFVEPVETKEEIQKTIPLENTLVSYEVIEISKELEPITLDAENFEIKEVKYLDGTITALKNKTDGELYFVPSHVCKLLGLDWSAQFRRIKRDEELKDVLAILATENNKSVLTSKNLLILPLEYLSIFLYGIESNSVKAELQANIKSLKKEIRKILLEAFSEKKELSQLEILHTVVGKMVDFEKCLKENSNLIMETKSNVEILSGEVTKIKSNQEIIIKNKEKATQVIKDISLFSKESNYKFEVDYRKLINKHINCYVDKGCLLSDNMTPEEKQEVFKEIRNRLYKNFSFVKINGKSHDFVKITSLENLANPNKKLKTIDIIENMGLLKEFYEFVQIHLNYESINV